VTAALFVGRFQETRGLDPGFKADGVLLAAYDLAGRVTTADQNRDFASRALAAARSIPGVASAALALQCRSTFTGCPRGRSRSRRPRAQDGTSTARFERRQRRLLETMGIRLLEGATSAV
jgi:hypothetical protein